MVDVYTGAKPGRPALLLVMSAAILAGTLGLAWWHVSAARALAPDVRVGDTPLLVRPPRGWLHHPKEPGTFILPVRRSIRGREQQLIERRLKVEMRRMPAFASLEDIIANLDQAEHVRSVAPRPCRVGPLEGVQVHRPIVLRLGMRTHEQERVMRLACSPRGELIEVEYIPLTGLTYGDLDLLDDVCASIRIDDPAFYVEPAAALAHAGLEFELEPDWQIVGPDIAEAPGLYVGGQEDGLAAWALSLFRTWLATGRTPRDLLSDFAAYEWSIAAEDVRVDERERPDGIKVATVRHPAFGTQAHTVASAWLVTKSASEVVLINVQAGPRHAAAADEAAARLAETLRFAATPVMPALDEAEAAGRDLASELAKKGTLPAWWGREERRAYYVGQTPGGWDAYLVQHAAVDRDPAAGYEGFLLNLFAHGQQRSEWKVDGSATSYSYVLTQAVEAGSGGGRFSLDERRAPGTTTVTRRVDLGGQPTTRTIAVGPAFVCPPAEVLAELLVARAEKPACVIQVSAHWATGTVRRLLQPLPPDDDGLRRVLAQVDYRPTGAVVAFDEDGEVRYEVYPTTRLERVTQQDAERRFPELRRWR